MTTTTTTQSDNDENDNQAENVADYNNNNNSRTEENSSGCCTGSLDDDDEDDGIVFPDIPRYYRIGDSPGKGRGLFAVVDIAPRTLLHVAPCLLVTQTEYQQHMRHTILEHYLFNCGADKFLALGDGSLFNHSSQHPNVDYRVDKTHRCIRYTSGHRPIAQDEELLICYGANLWFDEKDGACSSDDDDDDPNTFLGRLEL